MTSSIFFFLFIPLLAFILLAVNFIFAPHNPYQEKNGAFECGFTSFLGQNRTQFSISFFIFALLFLLFDLEILLVYPYLVSSYVNESYGLVILLIFLLALTLGFVFELGKKALTIDSRQTTQNKVVNIHTSLNMSSFFMIFKSIIFTVINYCYSNIRSIFYEKLRSHLITYFKGLINNYISHNLPVLLKFTLVNFRIILICLVVCFISMVTCLIFLLVYIYRNCSSVCIVLIFRIIVYSVVLFYITCINLKFKQCYPNLFKLIRFFLVFKISTSVSLLIFNIYYIHIPNNTPGPSGGGPNGGGPNVGGPNGGGPNGPNSIYNTGNTDTNHEPDGDNDKNSGDEYNNIHAIGAQDEENVNKAWPNDSDYDYDSGKTCPTWNPKAFEDEQTNNSEKERKQWYDKLGSIEDENQRKWENAKARYEDFLKEKREAERIRSKIYSADPEVKKWRREYYKIRNSMPEVRERVRQRSALPEVRERKRQYLRNLRLRRKEEARIEYTKNLPVKK